MSAAEKQERTAAGRNPPLCPVCGHGNLVGCWEGPFGWIEAGVERGEWHWQCGNCGESGVWLPSLAWKTDPFIEGRAQPTEDQG